MPETHYRIEHSENVTVHTQSPETAAQESRAGARVTATTVGEQV